MNSIKSLVFLCLIVSISPIYAVTIYYEAIDLEDTTPGEDLWQYAYQVEDHLFNADEGFTIHFDYMDYADLEDPTPVVNSDWDTLSLNTDPALPSNGTYDALALADDPSLQDLFNISFVWQGEGTPGSQSFDLYDSDFNVIESGITETLPEPPPPALIVVQTHDVPVNSHIMLLMMLMGALGVVSINKSRHFKSYLEC